MDYSRYKMNIRELVSCVVIYMAAAAVVAVLFYDSLIPCVFLSPGMIFFIKKRAAGKCRKRRQRLLEEFREMLGSLSANIAAGYSLEKAFVPVYQELDGIYGGDCYVQKEVLAIIRGTEMSVGVDELIQDFADRSGVPEIQDFAQMISVAKGSGGNMIRMMKKMANNIDGKREVAEEIDTMVTSRRLEHNIMSAMPIGIVLYMRVCNPGYMDALYGNAPGIVIMTVSIIVMALTVAWGRRILDIEL